MDDLGSAGKPGSGYEQARAAGIGAAADAGAPALTWYDGETRSLHLDYGGLRRQIALLGRWLAADQGVRHGDRVVVISSNAPEAFVAHLAIMSLGAITV